MSVLIGNREDETKETTKCPLLSSTQSDTSSPRSKHSRPRDTVRVVNEKVEKDEVNKSYYYTWNS